MLFYRRSRHARHARAKVEREPPRVDENGVFVDGKPFRFLSGEMHYFRIPRENWKDRIEKLKACGLNTLATYVPWNLHQPSEDEFYFDGIADLDAYLKLCKEEGLKVMLRPSPYICAEWDFGGLPAWLLKDRNLTIRCSDPKYLAAVKKYYDKLFEIVKPHFCNNGGAVVAIQLENEYDNFADDAEYIEFLRDYVLNTGFKGIIYSADPSAHKRAKPAACGRSVAHGNLRRQAGFDIQKDEAHTARQACNGQRTLGGSGNAPKNSPSRSRLQGDSRRA